MKHTVGIIELFSEKIVLIFYTIVIYKSREMLTVKAKEKKWFAIWKLLQNRSIKNYSGLTRSKITESMLYSHT